MVWKDGKPVQYDQRLWNAIRGQVVSCIKSHPDYFTNHGKNRVADSIAKRIYGQVMSEDFERLREEVAQAANDAVAMGISVTAGRGLAPRPSAGRIAEKGGVVTAAPPPAPAQSVKEER